MIDFFVQLGGFIMAPLYWITSIILSGFHQVLSPLLGYDSGWNWVLATLSRSSAATNSWSSCRAVVAKASGGAASAA